MRIIPRQLVSGNGSWLPMSKALAFDPRNLVQSSQRRLGEGK